ncbi:hypothetical protein LTR66_016601, partial [Elasticomyces elasticus]
MPTTPEFSKEFLFTLQVLSSAELKVDWSEVMVKTGSTRKDIPQQKFKNLIESTGKYALVRGKVIDLEADPNAPATPKPKGKGGKAAGTPKPPKSTGGGRKRKSVARKDESDDEEDSVAAASDNPATKKAKTTTKRNAAAKAQKKNKEDAEADSDDDATAEDKND